MFTKLLDKLLALKYPDRTVSDIRAEIKAEHDRIGDMQAQRFVRGNVNIKRGAYIFKNAVRVPR
jgi:hypothetical protein